MEINGNQGGTMLDELTNEELIVDGEGHSIVKLQEELDRVEGVISRTVLTGDDNSYFVERSRILERTIQNVHGYLNRMG